MSGTYFVQAATTTHPLLFSMVSSSDHVTPATGLTPTVLISKNGGSFASPAGAVSEVGHGLYQVAANATDNATAGPLVLYATASGADAAKETYLVVAFNPDSGTNLGLNSLASAASLTGLQSTANGISSAVSALASSTTLSAVQSVIITALTNVETSLAGSNPSTTLTSIATTLSSGVNINLAQAVPTTNTAQTVGDALNAARAQGFGKWQLSGTTLTLYAANGTTVVRTFTLDNATTPTTRS